jgi:restriction system-associated AAA family ATPase
MRLLRLKINGPERFRSLPADFEYFFRRDLDEAQFQELAPFICAGPNGSGKSNLLEVLAAIFFQLEIQRVQRSFLPEIFQNNEEDSQEERERFTGIPNAFELEYIIAIKAEYKAVYQADYAYVKVIKTSDTSPDMVWKPLTELDLIEIIDFEDEDDWQIVGDQERDLLLPQYVVAYSSGENEILSLPFFKMRFIQFDEYWNALTKQLPYPGRPETRLVYLDTSFSQAILLCNLLLQDQETPTSFREEIGISELKRFRIVIRKTILIDELQSDPKRYKELLDLAEEHSSLSSYEDEQGQVRYKLNIIDLLDNSEDERSILKRLQYCATTCYDDVDNGTLILDYWINDATLTAFKIHFEKPRILFQAFQVLLNLNLYTVSEPLKVEIYSSNSHYINESVPILASDQRIIRFDSVLFSKQGSEQPLLLKELSDGEHQLLHSLGLSLLFRHTNSLFLLDEPETHFNPQWRANFISLLKNCLTSSDEGVIGQEMLITTHSPFLISDSRPEQVLVFKKDRQNGTVQISHPEENTLGASINKITMTIFGKRETIGVYAQSLLDAFYRRIEADDNKAELIYEINTQLGDSIEKVLLLKTIFDSIKEEN